MAFTTFTGNVNVIQGLSDLPNATDGLTAAELKAKFDEAAGLIKTYINSTLLTEIGQTTDGDSGADNIGATSISGLSGSTVQALLESMYNKLTAVSPIGGCYLVTDPTYGLSGDGTTDNYSNLYSLINTTINGAKATIVVLDGDYRVASDITIPSNISLWFLQGGTIKPDSGKTITINGPVTAGLYQIFSGSGTITGSMDVEAYYPQWWGAKADLSTDDTDAIQKTITAAPYKKVVFTGSGFKVSGQITVGYPMILEGHKTTGQWLVASTVNNTTDILVIDPDVSDSEGYKIQDLWILPESGTPGRDMCRINTTSTKVLRQIEITGCYFRAKGSGYALKTTNPSGGTINPNGISFLTVKDNILYGGVYLENIGDSCFIENNNIKGPNIGIDVSMVNDTLGSSSALNIKSNNIKNDGGAIKINVFQNVAIENNLIEQEAVLDNGYAVILQSSITPADRASTFRNNRIACSDPTSKSNAMLVQDCQNLTIKDCDLYASASSSTGGSARTCLKVINSDYIKIKDCGLFISLDCVGINIDSASSYCEVGGGMSYTKSDPARATEFIDAGVGTVGLLRKSIGTAGWETAGTQMPVSCLKTDQNTVIVYGGNLVASPPSTTITGGTTICTLPTGFRPTQTCYHIARWQDTGGGQNYVNLRAGTDGTVTTIGTLNNFSALYLDGFMVFTGTVPS